MPIRPVIAFCLFRAKRCDFLVIRQNLALVDIISERYEFIPHGRIFRFNYVRCRSVYYCNCFIHNANSVKAFDVAAAIPQLSLKPFTLGKVAHLFYKCAFARSRSAF